LHINRPTLYPSISSVVEAGLVQLMLRDDAVADPLAGMAEEFNRRMELPLDQWLPWDGEEMMERVEKRARELKYRQDSAVIEKD
jgi:antitoxin ParD1/3/4